MHENNYTAYRGGANAPMAPLYRYATGMYPSKLLYYNTSAVMCKDLTDKG